MIQSPVSVRERFEQLLHVSKRTGLYNSGFFATAETQASGNVPHGWRIRDWIQLCVNDFDTPPTSGVGRFDWRFHIPYEIFIRWETLGDEAKSVAMYMAILANEKDMCSASGTSIRSEVSGNES